MDRLPSGKIQIHITPDERRDPCADKDGGARETEPPKR